MEIEEVISDLKYIGDIPPSSLCNIVSRTYCSLNSRTDLFKRKFWYRENAEITINYLYAVLKTLECYKYTQLNLKDLIHYIQIASLGLQFLCDAYRSKYGKDSGVVASINDIIINFNTFMYHLSCRQ
jgi:hypothetical protein